MKTRVDLSSYEKLYSQFDKGHDINHVNSVRDFAVQLAQKYAPDQVEIIYIAATLHDIGLSQGREQHQIKGAEIIAADTKFTQHFSPTELNLILEAIREHRASSGNPQSTAAKIVSDADKASDDTTSALKRAYHWGLQNLPELKSDEQLLRAARHLKDKFGPGGTGTRTYFPESAQKIIDCYAPIIQAFDNHDLDYLQSLLT